MIKTKLEFKTVKNIGKLQSDEDLVNFHNLSFYGYGNEFII